MKKKLLIFTTFLMAFFIGLGVSNAQEIKILNESTDLKTTKIDSKYAFTFVKPSSGTYTVETIGTTVSCGSYGEIFTLNNIGTAVCFKNSKNVGVTYKNIGKYEGKNVDLKILLTGYKAKSENASGTSGQYVLFDRTQVTIHQTNLDGNYTFEFLDSDTGKAIQINGFASFMDIDNAQYFKAIPSNTNGGINTWYVIQTTENKDYEDQDDTTGATHSGTADWVNIDASKVSLSTIKDSQGYYYVTGGVYGFTGRMHELKPASLNGYVVAIFDSVSKLSIDFGNHKTKAKNNTFYFGESSIKIAMPTPTKSVSKETLALGEEFTYTIEQLIPYQSSSNYYSSYTLTDTLEEYLTAKSAESIKVTDDTGADVTANFDIAVDGQKITAKAKNTDKEAFYGRTYSFTIPTIVSSKIPTSLFDSNGDYTIPNHATSTAVYKDGSGTETQDTNVVNVTVHKEAETVVVPKTSAYITFAAVAVGVLLIAGSITAYFVINRKKMAD